MPRNREKTPHTQNSTKPLRLERERASPFHARARRYQVLIRELEDVACAHAEELSALPGFANAFAWP